MKSPISIALIFALLYIIIKLIVFNMGKSVEWFVPLILVNIFLVLLAVLFGMRMWKKSKEGAENNFLEDLKCAMRNVSVYTIVISSFVYLYYAGIDKSFNDKFNEMNVKNLTKEQFEEIKKKDPVKMKDKTMDDYKKELRAEKSLFTSPFMTTTMTLMGLMMIGLFYSVIIVLAWPKVLSKIL